MSLEWFHWPLWLGKSLRRPRPTARIPLQGSFSIDLPPRLILDQCRLGTLEPRMGDTSTAKTARPCSLFQVRVEFAQALHDVPSLRVGDLATRIHRSTSLRELWHLRAEVAQLIRDHLGEHCALERMQRLQRHFPRFAPEAGHASAVRKC